MSRMAATLIGIVIAAPGCTAEKAKETDTTFANLKSLAEDIARAGKATLFEGLPHPKNEPGAIPEGIEREGNLHFRRLRLLCQAAGFESRRRQEADRDRLGPQIVPEVGRGEKVRRISPGLHG